MLMRGDRETVGDRIMRGDRETVGDRLNMGGNRVVIIIIVIIIIHLSIASLHDLRTLQRCIATKQQNMHDAA